jgi:hypothetical protein
MKMSFWENVFCTFLSLVGASCIIALWIFFTVPKLDYDYKMVSYEGGKTCITAEVNWGSNRTVFCSQNPNETLEMLSKMKTTLPKK